MYTLESAWFTFDEGKRGSLEPGKYADLAVLSDDDMTRGALFFPRPALATEIGCSRFRSLKYMIEVGNIRLRLRGSG